MAKAEQVRVDLTATDNASKVIDQVATKVDKLDDAKPKVEVDADVKGAERDVAALLTKVEKLTAEPAQLLLATNAVDITREITGLVSEIDKLDASDPTVDVKAEQVNALTADLETLQAKARELDGTTATVKVDTTSAVGGIDRLRDSSDQTKSVMANMAGNAAQDLGQVGGVAGTAGVAIGQLAEYATEGNISLGNLAKLAGPMVALGVATKAAGDYMAGIAAERAFRTDLVNDFAEAIREASTVADEMLETLRETGDLTFSEAGGGLFGLGRATTSLLGTLNDLGKGWQEWTSDVENSTGAIAAARAELREMTTGKTPFDAARVADLKDYIDALQQYGGAAEDAAAREAIRADLLADQASAERDAAIATGAHKQHLDEAAEAALTYEATTTDATAATADLTESHREALDVESLRRDALTAIADALIAQAGGARDLADANRDYAEAAQGSIDATAATTTAVAEHGAASREAADAATREADAIIATADAAVGQYEAMTAAAGATATATGKLEQQNSALVDQATRATPAARRQIVDYIGDLNGIPESERTDILTLLDQGKVAEAERKINDTSRTRTSTINADANTSAAENDLNHAARDRSAIIRAQMQLNPFRAPPGVALPSMLPVPEAPPVATPVVNVTQYVPRGFRGDALEQAHAAARRSGGLFRHVRR